MPDNDDTARIISESDKMVEKCGDGLKELNILFSKVSYAVFCLFWYLLKGMKVHIAKQTLVSAMSSNPQAMDED